MTTDACASVEQAQKADNSDRRCNILRITPPLCAFQHAYRKHNLRQYKILTRAAFCGEQSAVEIASAVITSASTTKPPPKSGLNRSFAEYVLKSALGSSPLVTTKDQSVRLLPFYAGIDRVGALLSSGQKPTRRSGIVDRDDLPTREHDVDVTEAAARDS